MDQPDSSWSCDDDDGEDETCAAGFCPTLAIVVPCYNEQDVLPETARRLDRLLAGLAGDGRIAADSSVLLVDDGSTDGTWRIIRTLRKRFGTIGGVRLSRNRGHQNALVTGLLLAGGNVVISVDADLQDDLEAIDAMLRMAANGAEIVYGVRSGRRTDALPKRLLAHCYYRLLALLDVDVVFDHADFRLMTRRVVEALRQYEESNLFLRALIPQLGFRTGIVHYERAARFAGSSKYSLPRMLGLALDGITSFSARPLHIVTMLGCGVSAVAVLLTAWALFAALVLRATVPGWASTVVPIYLICGVQLLCTGIIGEYVGKVYLETKRRPRSHVAETLAPVLSGGARRGQSRPADVHANGASALSGRCERLEATEGGRS